MNNNIKNILDFMQTEDRNGSWLEWFEEIKRGESEFDKEYVIGVLKSWYEDGDKEQKYLNMVETVSNIK